ncbi:dnaJ homolog subfamily C member 30, mitochondrial-like [Ptychodera flava]|uniref:dnaJ homolog subfamily C member 30, mitochondrial-like n=1 Tax=Ptychodera flava TaxID=63121 RepID=UPI00396A3AC8
MFKLTLPSSLSRCLAGARTYRTSTYLLQASRPAVNKRKNYYDVLGVSAKATHAQIKSAFYSLSKMYHPDVNQGDVSASLKFSEITEAYNVLGNHTLRRRYDKGILGPRDFRGEVKPERTSAPMKKEGNIYTGTMKNSRGETVFDFDEFYRHTYGAQLAEEQRRRRLREHFKQMEQVKQKKENKLLIGETGLLIGGAMLVYLIYILGFKDPIQSVKKLEK